MIELGELMDHYGYKWWKKQVPDVDQCKLEVIDIAHFYISYLIQTAIRNNLSYDSFVEDFTNGLFVDAKYEEPEEIRKLIDECIFRSAAKSFTIDCLAHLMIAFNITPEELCNKYIIKNTLNIFRASNGYKEGTYTKTWDGKEDNEVLMEVFNTMDSSSPSLADDLYEKLKEAYSKVKKE
jgi:hypothetical protein